jgi:hypothetical protein
MIFTLYLGSTYKIQVRMKKEVSDGPKRVETRELKQVVGPLSRYHHTAYGQRAQTGPNRRYKTVVWALFINDEYRQAPFNRGFLFNYYLNPSLTSFARGGVYLWYIYIKEIWVKGQGRTWTGPQGPGPGPAKLGEGQPGPTRGQSI